jgi:pimeloyl-ACP methyl ester carboxylesterase
MVIRQTENGIDVVYERNGGGQPVILLHGGMAPPDYWRRLVPHMRDYTTIIPQRPGFGTCSDSLEETSASAVLDRETAYVRALVEAVDGDPILFGHSYGGITAIETATNTPVEAVVAYEPAALPQSYRENADLAARMAASIEAGERAKAVKEYIEQVLHPEGITDIDDWLAEWPVWPDCVELAEEVVRMNRAVEQYQIPDTIPVDAPVQIMTGTAGPQFLRESGRLIHRALEQSRFVEFDGVSHSGPSEAPQLIASEVQTFLRPTVRC